MGCRIWGEFEKTVGGRKKESVAEKWLWCVSCSCSYKQWQMEEYEIGAGLEAIAGDAQIDNGLVTCEVVQFQMEKDAAGMVVCRQGFGALAVRTRMQLKWLWGWLQMELCSSVGVAVAVAGRASGDRNVWI
ncbi:hypothetical protein C5167_032725 [Papaver somniferum]|uniref:Uncharacterized protein n=1 Tax=Papaver somniferum TaxID=3469 RepID=A0A4Y7K8B7_PAPSO|nr:hypothetical protein C5167_032725 [Papaver somniferum]